MALNDKIADNIRVRAITLARIDAGLRRKILALLKRVETELVGKLAMSDISGEMTAENRRRLQLLLREVRATIATNFETASTTMAQQLTLLAKTESTWITNDVNRQAGVALIEAGLSAAQLESIVGDLIIRGAPSAEWWTGQSVTLQNKFAQAIRLGLAQGETNADLVKRIRGTRDAGYTDGVMFITRRDANSLVRTSVQTVANAARLETYKANADVVGELQFVATLDDRTTQQCAALDGKRWKLDGTPVGHDIAFQQPPLHWNCRSTLIPVTVTWKEMGFDAPELTGAQRASMDGQVPEDTTYETWLRKKPVEFQDRVLGAGKAELWRDGKISFRDLVDQSGRPLTLEEIRDDM